MSNSRPIRADIQALRALAVLMVVLFHLWPNRLSGGFAGVDVFFVISGFLISKALFRELADSGRIAIVRFWARRIRRLLPAALLVIAVTALVSFLAVPV
ncbi:MAG: acyltransferase, partial [Rhodoluna sp.]|nr:acyltransferase [Rhodoluna sp.]